MSTAIPACRGRLQQPFLDRGESCTDLRREPCSPERDSKKKEARFKCIYVAKGGGCKQRHLSPRYQLCTSIFAGAKLTEHTQKCDLEHGTMAVAGLFVCRHAIGQRSSQVTC
ncbi:hypothetical protein Bbelb_166430 [Branchiostoma belcheri]|nr:hypothetical protein Bbelb_166430 [Branchiostoma belcheri]